MRKAVIITSVLQVDANHDFTYSTYRSYWNEENRFYQTIETCLNIQECFDSETTFYLVDGSDNYEKYVDSFSFVPNLKFISVKKEMPEILHIVRTHPNKSTCECTLLYTFLLKYREELSQYDYFFKLSGRYKIDKEHFDIELFNNKNDYYFYFKEPHKWDWESHWGYKMVDLREKQGNNKLYQYSTVLYGFTNESYNLTIGLLKEIAHLCAILNHYDVETLIYYLTRPYENKIFHPPWIIYGKMGIDGLLMHC